MNKNQKKKLEELKIELDAYVLMSQLVFSIYNNEGEWQKANKKWKHSPNVVYWNDLEGYGISVDGDGNFKAFNDTDFVCPITLPKFVEVLLRFSTQIAFWIVKTSLFCEFFVSFQVPN